MVPLRLVVRLVAVAECDGDLDALRERLEQQHRASLNGRADVEAKLSHLGDLVQRLSAVGLEGASLAGTVPADKPDTFAGALSAVDR